MFYEIELEDYVRVKPDLFALPIKEAILAQLKESYAEKVDKDLGIVISVIGVSEIDRGILVPGDGAAYHRSVFTLLTYKPELHELVYGIVSEITNFGAFMSIGPIDGMLHISQAMDDYVTFSKTGTLLGRNTRKSLRKGDLCLARISAISYKAAEPKIGLTMRQPGLGRLDWIEEEKRKAKAAAAAAKPKEKKEK